MKHYSKHSVIHSQAKVQISFFLLFRQKRDKREQQHFVKKRVNIGIVFIVSGCKRANPIENFDLKIQICRLKPLILSNNSC